MPWSGVPKTWIAGAVLPASDLNTEVRDRFLTIRGGGIAITSQAALDFIYAVDDDQFGRVAAVASRYPRANAGLTAWEMAIPTAGAHQLFIPAGALRPLPTGGAGWHEDATSTNVISGLPFDPTTSEAAYFWVALPKAWNEGTLTARFYTFNKAGGSGNFVFSLAGVAVSDDDAISSALGIAQQVTDGALAAYDVQRSAATAAITVAGAPAFGDLCLFVVKRLPADAADTYGSDIYLEGISLELITDAENDA